MEQFNVGELVELKSGGPGMTVVDADKTGVNGRRGLYLGKTVRDNSYARAKEKARMDMLA